MKSTSDEFNNLRWHDSKLRSLRIVRINDDLDEVHLEVELRGTPGQELAPMTVVLEDAVFIFCDIDLQGKRECSDDISSAKCDAKTDLMAKIQTERLQQQHSPGALAAYYHFSIYLIPPGGSLDVIASGFRLEPEQGVG